MPGRLFAARGCKKSLSRLAVIIEEYVGVVVKLCMGVQGGIFLAMPQFGKMRCNTSIYFVILFLGNFSWTGSGCIMKGGLNRAIL